MNNAVKTKFVVWHNTDPSVGGETLTATIEADVSEELVTAAKTRFSTLFALLWGASPRDVVAMTAGEYEALAAISWRLGP
jgi:hypothetical protein